MEKIGPDAKYIRRNTWKRRNLKPLISPMWETDCKKRVSQISVKKRERLNLTRQLYAFILSYITNFSFLYVLLPKQRINVSVKYYLAFQNDGCLNNQCKHFYTLNCIRKMLRILTNLI